MKGNKKLTLPKLGVGSPYSDPFSEAFGAYVSKELKQQSKEIREAMTNKPTYKHIRVIYPFDPSNGKNWHIESEKPKTLIGAIKNFIWNKYALWRCRND